MSVEITAQSSHAGPILVTGAAGAVGSIGRNLTEMLLAKGHKVRALVRREDGRAEALRQLGAEVMQGDLPDLTAMHRAIDGCVRTYFGMSVSADYLTATVNTAAPEHFARVFSEALGRTIRYRDVPLSGWSEKLLEAGVPAHAVRHLSVMAELTKQGRYDRMTDDLFKFTGQKPITMYDFVKLHIAEFTREKTSA